MQVLVVGVNHRSAPIAVRERLAFRREHLAQAFARLQAVGVRESTILSTCNRVEIYAGAEDVALGFRHLQGALSEQAGVALEHLAPTVYCLQAPHSVQHLFRVASGLDSLIVGESEIVGQVKDAYERARSLGATQKLLNGLFQRALNTAKAVRTQTGLERAHVSVGSVALELAGKIFGDVRKKTVLLVGAGEVAESTLKRLAERGVSQVHLLNRSYERAQRLAVAYRAAVWPLEALPNVVLAADIVLFSAAVEQPLWARAAMEQAMRARHQRPLCIIDLGVPRNVDPAVASVDNVYLFNIDDLEQLKLQSSALVEEAVAQSQAIIDRKVAQFLRWWEKELCAFV
jgi:glutamyl-tRNA reductase